MRSPQVLEDSGRRRCRWGRSWPRGGRPRRRPPVSARRPRRVGPTRRRQAPTRGSRRPRRRRRAIPSFRARSRGRTRPVPRQSAGGRHEAHRPRSTLPAPSGRTGTTRLAARSRSPAARPTARAGGRCALRAPPARPRDPPTPHDVLHQPVSTPQQFHPAGPPTKPTLTHLRSTRRREEGPSSLTNLDGNSIASARFANSRVTQNSFSLRKAGARSFEETLPGRRLSRAKLRDKKEGSCRALSPLELRVVSTRRLRRCPRPSMELVRTITATRTTPRRTAACKSCQRVGNLESYDTRLWFVVVFIPIIPLGRKRIIDKCPSCTRHYVMKADVYEQSKQLQISAGLERFRREPSAGAAIEAHGQLLGFHEHQQAADFRDGPGAVPGPCRPPRGHGRAAPGDVLVRGVCRALPGMRSSSIPSCRRRAPAWRSG